MLLLLAQGDRAVGFHGGLDPFASIMY